MERRKQQRGKAKACTSCGARKTRQWRHDGDGRTLCNACGIRFSRGRAMAEKKPERRGKKKGQGGAGGENGEEKGEGEYVLVGEGGWRGVGEAARRMRGGGSGKAGGKGVFEDMREALPESGVPGACSAFHAVVEKGEDGGSRVVLRALQAGGEKDGPVVERTPFMGAAPYAERGMVDYSLVVDARAGAELRMLGLGEIAIGKAGRALGKFEQSERYTEYLRQRWRGVRALDVAFDCALAEYIGDLFARNEGKSGWMKARRLVNAVMACNPGLTGKLDYCTASLEGWQLRLDGYDGV